MALVRIGLQVFDPSLVQSVQWFPGQPASAGDRLVIPERIVVRLRQQSQGLFGGFGVSGPQYVFTDDDLPKAKAWVESIPEFAPMSAGDCFVVGDKVQDSAPPQ